MSVRGYFVVPLLLLTGCSGTYTPSHWLERVPAAAHAAANPLPAIDSNVAAGRDTYRLYCVSCHGEQGVGRRGRPALDTPRVQGETDGDLYWILENGSHGHGMPAWKSLGSTALWQLVEYIRSLPPAPMRK